MSVDSGGGGGGGGGGSCWTGDSAADDAPSAAEQQLQQEELSREARKRAERRRRHYERALDCLHVRLLPPLVGLSLALTLVFMAAWIDGDLQKWGYWRVLAPIWIACGVAAMAAATAVHAWREQAVNGQSLRSTFSGLRGAVRYFMSEVVQDQAVGIASGVGLLFLLTLELIVLGLQVEGIIEANWFVVFLPLFCCFLILCLSPCLQWASWGEGGAYLLGMLLGWIPAVLCVLLVCFRLEGDDVSMSVVMAPLWAVDLILVLAPVGLAIAVAVRKVRHGEPVEAMLVHTLAASWCLLTPVLAPIVAFEIALAVYVEGKRDALTAAEVFTPLIVWCCVLSLILCGYSCSYPPRHPDPPEGTLENDPGSIAQTPTGFATRLPRPRPSAAVGSGTGTGTNTAGTGIGGGRNNRRRSLQFPTSAMSPIPSSMPQSQHHHHHHPHHPPPRPLTPAPHANGAPAPAAGPDAADGVALRSQLAEMGVMAGFLDPSSPSLSEGGSGGRRAVVGGGGASTASGDRRRG